MGQGMVDTTRDGNMGMMHQVGDLQVALPSRLASACLTAFTVRSVWASMWSGKLLVRLIDVAVYSAIAGRNQHAGCNQHAVHQ